MALVADDLLRDRRRPVALRRLADDDHRPAIGGIPVFHRLQHAEDLRVVVAVRDREDVPSVRRPLIAQHVAVGELARHHAADERVVDAGVVVGEEDAEPLAGLHGHRLRLQLLRVPGAHRELAFEGDDLRRVDVGAEEVPEGGLAGRGREADARGAAVDVVGDVGGFDVA